MKIEKGKHYECINDVFMSGYGTHEFIKGNTYVSDQSGFLTNESGNPEHGVDEDFASDHFKEHDVQSIETETRPTHYGGDTNPHEPIKIIQHYGLSFELGNVIKYVLRSDKKGQRESDLNKAMQYLQFELNKLNKTNRK